MAYTFLRAKGIPVGKSLLQEEKISEAKNIMDKASEKNCRILLPLDHIVAKEAREGAETKTVGQDMIPPDWLALDIGPETLKLFAGSIRKARTVFWNGPMGMFEIEDFARGTETIAKMLAECDATVVVGGGDAGSGIRS